MVVSKQVNNQQEMTCTLTQNSIKYQRTLNCKIYYPYEQGRRVTQNDLQRWTKYRSADTRADESPAKNYHYLCRKVMGKSN